MILLQRRESIAVARSAGEYLRSAENVEIQASDASVMTEAWGEFVANPGSLTYPDCVVMVHCRHLAAEPLAFEPALLLAFQR